jgi:DNA-binding LacI/PurR family transcriptional regulator
MMGNLNAALSKMDTLWYSSGRRAGRSGGGSMPETKHRDVLRVLKSRLLRGVYPGRLPGDRALAEELGISQPTVKVVLAQLEVLGFVRREARRGTFAMSRAEQRAAGISMLALMVLSSRDSTAPWVMRVLLAFEDAAKRHGIDTIVLREEGEGGTKTDAVIDQVLAHLRNVTCVGACLFGVQMTTAQALRLRNAGGAVVLADIDSGDPVLDSVVFDNEMAGRRIAEHLLGLGHRNVAWLDAGDPTGPRTVRREAAQKVFEASGARMRFVGRPECRSYSQAGQELLRSNDRPSAMILGGVAACAGVAEFARQLGIQTPGQLSLLSMSDFSSDTTEVVFSGINFHPEEMGRLAFERMLHIKPGGEIQIEKVPVEFVDRGSTARALG